MINQIKNTSVIDQITDFNFQNENQYLQDELQMKTQQSQITMSSTNFIDKNNKLLCSAGKQALNLCSSKICQNYAFLCSDKNCQCRLSHSECLKTDIQGLIKNIQQHSMIAKPLINKIQQLFQNCVRQLQSHKQMLISKIQSTLKSSETSDLEKQFLTHLQNGQVEAIFGSMIWKIQSHFYQQQNLDFSIQIFTSQCDKQLSEFNKKIKKFILSLQKNIEIFQKLSKHQILFEKSKIIRSQKDFNALIGFFPNKIKATRLQYRASDNSFLLQKFYEKCSNIKATLTICETQFGKVIGGFTNLEWFKTQKCQQISDESGESFLFSITNGDKFVLQNKKYGINRSSYNNYGPAFGNGWDFFIRDKANQNIFSGGRINSSYANENYKNQSKEQKFLGNPKGSPHCKLKQWQVWKIQFQDCE